MIIFINKFFIMKLIMEYFEGDDCNGDWFNVCFEYESKEHFLFDVLEKAKGLDDGDIVKIFGRPIYFGELNQLEHNLYTIDEWHQKMMEENVEYSLDNFIELQKIKK